MPSKQPKEYTYVNDAGLTVPAAKVNTNSDGTIGIFYPEGTGGQVVYLDNVAKGDGGGYYQEVKS